MSQIAIQRSVDGVPTSADAAHLDITTPSGATVISGVLVPPTSAGVYSYSTSALSPGEYRATWTFTVAGLLDDVVSRNFIIDNPLQTSEGITLADLELAVARAMGPAENYKVSTGTTSTLVIPELKSNLDLGDVEDQYLLRRGISWDGAWINPYADDDRVRMISSYTPSTGIVEVDRVWTNGPGTNEAVEIHALDPMREIRRAVLEGLRSCYFWDNVTISWTGTYRPLDITAAIPWITRPGQIGQIFQGWAMSALVPPRRVPWQRVYQSGRKVYLDTSQLGMSSIQIEALRPHFTLVNGELQLAGPNDDWDVLHVDRQYAILAGHRAGWMYFPERLAPLAALKMRPSQEMVASMFTTRSRAMVPSPPEYSNQRWDLWSDPGIVGNLPEVPI